MDWLTAAEIASSALGLIGIFCLVKYVADTFFLPREIVTALTILDEESRENADLLLRILKSGMWRQANRRILVIIAESYSGDEELLKMINDTGAEYIAVSDK